MAAAIATIASSALAPSASNSRPASAAAWCGAATTPRRCPEVCIDMDLMLSVELGGRLDESQSFSHIRAIDRHVQQRSVESQIARKSTARTGTMRLEDPLLKLQSISGSTRNDLPDPVLLENLISDLAAASARTEFSWSSLHTYLPPGMLKAARESRLAIFFGAGVSLSSGAPLWSTLLRDYFRLESNFVDDIDLQRDTLTLAEIAASRLGIETVQAILKSAYGDLKRPSTSHYALAALRSPIYITTNYDQLFETAFTRLYPTWHECIKVVVPADLLKVRDLLKGRLDDNEFEKLPTACENLESAELLLSALERSNARVLEESTGTWISLLIKLHGSAEHGSGGLILTRSQYRKHYSTNILLFNIVRHILFEYETLFCGFSHADPEVSRLIDDVIHEYESGGRKKSNEGDRGPPRFYSLQFGMSAHTPEVFAARGIVALSSPSPKTLAGTDVRSIAFNTALSDLITATDDSFKLDFGPRTAAQALRKLIQDKIDAGLGILEQATSPSQSILKGQRTAEPAFENLAQGLFEKGFGTQGLYLCNSDGKSVKMMFPPGFEASRRTVKIQNNPAGFSKRPYMQQAKMHQHAFVSELFRSDFNQLSTFMLVQPILDRGSLLGMIFAACQVGQWQIERDIRAGGDLEQYGIYLIDRKSTRLNSRHTGISRMRAS